MMKIGDLSPESGEAAVVNEGDAESVMRGDTQNVRIWEIERAKQFALSCICIVL